MHLRAFYIRATQTRPEEPSQKPLRLVTGTTSRRASESRGIRLETANHRYAPATASTTTLHNFGCSTMRITFRLSATALSSLMACSKILTEVGSPVTAFHLQHLGRIVLSTARSRPS